MWTSLLFLAISICFNCIFLEVSSYSRKRPPTYPPIFSKPTPYQPNLFYLFIYGKLKKNEENHYWLTNPENGLSKFVGLGETAKRYPLIVGKYKTPILLHTPGTGHKILGEIYVVDTFMLRNLDMLEGCPVFNTRKLDVVKIFTEESTMGKEMLCWFYFARIGAVDLNGRNMLSEFVSKNIPD